MSSEVNSEPDIIIPEETPEFALPASPPRTTPPRDYDEESPPNTLPLMPNSPAGKQMVSRFKRTVAQHMEDRDEKTTDQFLEELCLDLWRATRRA